MHCHSISSDSQPCAVLFSTPLNPEQVPSIMSGHFVSLAEQLSLGAAMLRKGVADFDDVVRGPRIEAHEVTRLVRV